MGEAEGVCSGAGEGVTESAGEIDKAGDSSVIADGVVVGDSWAKATEAKKPIRNVKPTFLVIPSEVEESLDVLWTKQEMSRFVPDWRIRSRLDIVAPVHVWKKIVARFTFAQKFFIHGISGKLIV